MTVYVIALLVSLAALNLCIGLRSHRHLQLNTFFAFWELHSPTKQYEVQYRKGLNPRDKQLLPVCTDGISCASKFQHKCVQPSFTELTLKHQVWLVLDGCTSLGSEEEEEQVGSIPEWLLSGSQALFLIQAQKPAHPLGQSFARERHPSCKQALLAMHIIQRIVRWTTQRAVVKTQVLSAQHLLREG